MDLNSKEKVEEGSKLDGVGTVSNNNMESKSLRSISSKDMIFRADKIDLKSFGCSIGKAFESSLVEQFRETKSTKA